MIRLGPASAFLPAGERQSDTLLLLSTSFESRCLGFARHIRSTAPHYSAESVVVVQYDDRGDATIKARANRFIPELLDHAKQLAVGGRPDVQRLDPFATLSGMEFFSSLFARIPPESSVVVDVSTISKLHVLYVLAAARRSRRVRSLRLAYTRARYGRYDTLSWGAQEPIIVPSFGAPPLDLRHRDRLVLFCGLEPERCYSIWKRFGQNSCVQVFVNAGEEDLDRCAERAERLNAYAPSSSKKTIPAFSPDGVAAYLRDEYAAASREGQYLYVAPMTTKWEILGTWMFFEELGSNVSAAIAYAVPGRLNAAGHTREDLGECLTAIVW